MEYKEHPRRSLQHLISIPFIYMMIVPFIVLDVSIEIYHRICFPLYGLKQVKRSDYIIFDRQKLSYLTWYDKINCTYCAYGNGLLLYAAAIAAETEKYWCGIKHYNIRIKTMKEEEKDFLPFGDKKAFEKEVAIGEKEEKKD